MEYSLISNVLKNGLIIPKISFKIKVILIPVFIALMYTLTNSLRLDVSVVSKLTQLKMNLAIQIHVDKYVIRLYLVAAITNANRFVMMVLVRNVI